MPFNRQTGAMTDLTGYSILVVGATGGLGREISSLLASKGARLTLTGRSEEALRDLGLPGLLVPGDVRESGTAERFVKAAVDGHGQLDGVIYAAGVVAFGPASEVSEQTLDHLWEVNAKAPMALLAAASPELEKSAKAGRQPFLLALSGVVAESPTAGLAAYSAVKSALHAHWSAAGRELRKVGVRLLDARPGHTETALSTHPVAGVAPVFPSGLSAKAVATRIVEGIENDERDLPSAVFQALG
jgi:short-subunit dehydrogenase